VYQRVLVLPVEICASVYYKIQCTQHSGTYLNWSNKNALVHWCFPYQCSLPKCWKSAQSGHPGYSWNIDHSFTSWL